MMDGVSWNDLSNICNCIGIPTGGLSNHCLEEQDCVSSLNPQGIISWDQRTETYADFLEQKDDIFTSASAGKNPDSHQLLPLPLTASNSFCNQRTDSNPNPAARKFKRAKAGCSSIEFRRDGGEEVDGEAVAQLKEIIYTAAALRPVILGAEEVAEKPKRKNLRISNDPQTAAARHRRERISNRLRVLQRLVPGGRKMDTASMLDEAANYLKFLKAQITDLETAGNEEGNFGLLRRGGGAGAAGGGVNCGYDMLPFPVTFSYCSSSAKQQCIFPPQNLN